MTFRDFEGKLGGGERKKGATRTVAVAFGGAAGISFYCTSLPLLHILEQIVHFCCSTAHELEELTDDGDDSAGEIEEGAREGDDLFETALANLTSFFFRGKAR